jgi:hypothetical protein
LIAAQKLESLYDIELPAAKREAELEFMETLLGGKSLSELTERLRELLRLMERHGLANSVCQVRVVDAYEAAARRRTSTGPAPTLREVRDEFQRTNHVALLPNEWVMRKMLGKTFGLPLAKAKRGRPVGSRAIIRNRRR